MTRRVLAVMTLLALASCDADGSQAASQGEPLSVVLPRQPQQIDPRLTGDAYGLKVSRMLFASLVTIDPHSLEPVPDLAESVEIVDPTTYRVRLRKGLRFSDGSRLNAKDVLATFRSVVADDIGSRYAHTYRRIASMSSPDARTVVFRLTEPHATFLTDLELPILRAEDEHRHIAPTGDPPVGAGPYRLTEWSREGLRLRANPHWHRGEPRYPDVRMVVVHDDNTRALRMLAGSGDLAMNAVPPLLLPMFEEEPRFRVRARAGIGTSYVGLNLEAEPLNDRRVRRAIAHAIDRRALIETKLHGHAHLARSWIVPGHWAYDEGLRSYAYDPERARRLLDEAGLARDGDTPRLTLTLRVGADRFAVSMARAIAAMLGRVGVRVRVRPSEMATMLADLGKGRFELTLLEVPEVVEPHVLSWFFASDRIPGPSRSGGANRWRFRSEALDAALERGRSTPERQQRIRAYHEAQRILARELPVIPLWHRDVVAVTSRQARGFEVPRDGRFATLARGSR